MPTLSTITDLHNKLEQLEQQAHKVRIARDSAICEAVSAQTASQYRIAKTLGISTAAINLIVKKHRADKP